MKYYLPVLIMIIVVGLGFWYFSAIKSDQDQAIMALMIGFMPTVALIFAAHRTKKEVEKSNRKLKKYKERQEVNDG